MIALMAERAQRVGVAFRVVPQIERRAGVLSSEVIAASLTAQVEIAGDGTSGDSWVVVETVADVDRAANVRAQQTDTEVPPRVSARTEDEGWGVYPESPLNMAAMNLANVDLTTDGVPGVTLVEAGADDDVPLDADQLPGIDEPVFGPDPEVQLHANWNALTAPDRSHDVVTLALVARSLVTGQPVDLSRLAQLEPALLRHTARCLALIGKTGRDD